MCTSGGFTMDSIVLVDDEAPILDIQKESLEGLDAEIQTFTDPCAAWVFIQQGDVALVVTDWNMPGMTGMDLLFRIRGLERPPYTMKLYCLRHQWLRWLAQAVNQAQRSISLRNRSKWTATWPR